MEKGKKYLIIGPSGGGKSTVLRLLRKYFNPNDGDIIIDGVSLKDVKKNDYYTKPGDAKRKKAADARKKRAKG